jgi:hypothetical protein
MYGTRRKCFCRRFYILPPLGVSRPCEHGLEEQYMNRTYMDSIWRLVMKLPQNIERF